MRLLLMALACAQVGAVCKPVPTLDVAAYIGRWYQVYYNPLMLLFSSPGCSTALYGVDRAAPVPTITVNNSGLDHSGKSIAYIGTAAENNASTPGDLTLLLHGVPGKASYRICQVGPKSYLGKYHEWCARRAPPHSTPPPPPHRRQARCTRPHPAHPPSPLEPGVVRRSIVTDDSGLSLYVMARNVSSFFAEYDDEVRGLLKHFKLHGALKNRQSACPADIYYPPWP